MAKLRILSGREICTILAQHGFEEVRQRGSHVIMQKKTEDSTITIPIPNHREIRTGTLMSIVRFLKPTNDLKSTIYPSIYATYSRDQLLAFFSQGLREEFCP